jgi:chromate transporter
MSDNRLLGLVLVFAPLSALSFGGGQAIIADMQHQTVAQGWLSDTEFADLFAISRAAPGPSTLISALIGWQVAGLVGALVATLAMYAFSSSFMQRAAGGMHGTILPGETS